MTCYPEVSKNTDTKLKVYLEVSMAKIVFLYTRINQAKKLGVDPALLVKSQYNALNGVWDDINKKFVAPNTLDWGWTKQLLKEMQ